MNKQKGEFALDIPLVFEDSSLKGVTILQVYSTVYNISPKNNKLKIYLSVNQLKEFGVDLELATEIENVYTYFRGVEEYNNSVIEINKSHE